MSFYFWRGFPHDSVQCPRRRGKKRELRCEANVVKALCKPSALAPAGSVGRAAVLRAGDRGVRASQTLEERRIVCRSEGGGVRGQHAKQVVAAGLVAEK